jgi:ATP-dependent protease ClpP protease subunit
MSQVKQPFTTFLHLFGDTNAPNIRDITRAIDIAIMDDYVDEICIILNSGGGNLYYAFGLYDHILASPKPIDIIAEGTCQSSAVMILQAARRRYSRPNTVFMVHPTWNQIPDRTSYMEYLAETEQYKRNHELCVQLTIQRSGMSKITYEKFYDPIRYLTPEEALQFGQNGLIDEVVEGKMLKPALKSDK